MTLRERSPEWKSGVQAAWEVVNRMIGTLPVEPRTNNVQMMRDTALDIADAILALKNGTDGECASTKEG